MITIALHEDVKLYYDYKDNIVYSRGGSGFGGQWKYISDIYLFSKRKKLYLDGIDNELVIDKFKSFDSDQHVCKMKHAGQEYLIGSKIKVYKKDKNVVTYIRDKDNKWFEDCIDPITTFVSGNSFILISEKACQMNVLCKNRIFPVISPDK